MLAGLHSIPFEVVIDVSLGQHNPAADAAERDPMLLHQPSQQPEGECRVSLGGLFEGEVATPGRRNPRVR
jgi:hypothetical protein